MRKFLLFCFLSIWMAVSMCTASAYAQEGTSESCCFWLENEQPSRPENLYKMETAQIGETHYYTIHFTNNCNMPLDSRISLDWELLDPNGQPIDGNLYRYADLAFQIDVAGSSVTGEDGSWVGDNVRTGMGRTSVSDPRPSDFPGFVLNDPANNLGSQDGYFHLTPENQYDFLLLHFLMHASDNDLIRVKITWKAYGNYTLIAKLNERTGGTIHENFYLPSTNQFYLPSTNQNIYYGGKQSRFVREIARFTLETMTYGDDERTACSGDTIWAGRPAIPFVFNPVIPQPTVDTTFEVFYTTQRCFGTYVDSIVNTRFVVAPIPPVPVVSGDFAICGAGTTTLTASSEYTEQYNLNFNWYASEEDAEPLYVGAVYSPNLDTEDTTYNFYVRAVTPEGCEGDALLVSVKVNKQPGVTLAFEENYCPDGTTREIIATPTNFYGPISYSWIGATGTGASAQVATTDDCGATYNFSVVITDETSECTATASGSFTQIDAVAPVINNKSREVSATATVCGESLLPEYEGYDALLEAGFKITDNCSDSADDFTVELVSTTELDPVDCKKVFVRTYALTDHCGNSVEFNDTVVVVDTIAPTFTTPEVVAILEPVYNGSCELLLPNNVNDWINSTFAPVDNCSDVTITLSRTSGDVEEDIQPLSELTLEAGDVVVDGEVITVTFADACGNTSSTTFTIDAPEALQVEAIADQYVACFDEDLTFDLTATPANGIAPYTYAWSTSYEGATVINPNASTTEATPNYGGKWSRPVYVTQNITYTVVVTDANGCTATDTVNVIVNALPNVGNVPSSVAVCYDAAVVIELEDYISDESYNYTWKTHSLTYPSIPSISGEFDGNSAVLPADYTQQIVDVCEDAWSPAVCNLVSRVIVEVTDENTGCKNDRIVNIKVNDPITYTTTELTPAICGGETVTMAVNTTNDYTYRWYHTLNGNFYSNASSYTVTPPAGPDYAAPYYYTVDIIQTQNGIECKKSEDFVVTVNYIPTFQINQGVDTIALCEGEEVTLSADKEQYSYTWSTGATTQSIVVEATAAGTVEYTATAATVEGCTYAQSVVVNTLPLPVITAQPVAEDNSICTGNTTVLSVVAEGATQYQWQIFDGEDWANIDGANAPVYTTTALEAVTYKYRVIIANDGESIYGTCQVASEEVEVVANPAEIVTIVTDHNAVCDNSEVVIEISEPNEDLTYQWQIFDGEDWTSLEGETENSLVYSLTQTTQFRVVANNAVTNCSPISNELTIDSIARPIAQLLLDGKDADLYFCYRDSIIPSQINCLNSEAFTGHVLKFDFIVPDRVEAPGTEQIIIKGVGDFYVGAFILDETTGCSSDTVWHWIYSKGYPEYAFAEVASFCDGDVATMEIVPQEETYTYTWLSANGDTLLNGLGEAVYAANVNGTQKFYTVVSAPHAEQDFSCSTIDSIEVTANPLPEFEVLDTESVEYCNSNKLGRIYVSDTNYSYKLNGNDVVLVGNYIDVATHGYYEVTAINTVTGCEYSIDSVRVDSLNVDFNVQLLIEGVNADYFVPCGTPLPDSLVVNVSYTKPADMECTYSLLTGTLQSPSNQQVIVAEHGVYTLGAYVTNTTSNCVSDTVYHQIIAVPTPNGEITPDASICFGDSITLTYEHDYYDYLDTTRFGWSDGSIISREPSVVVKPTETTTYTLYVNNVIDNMTCGAVKHVTVTVNQLPAAGVVYSSSCPTADNTFAAVQVAGAAPFTYSWNAGEYGADSTFTTNNAVCGDTIMVALNVKDANGCVSNTIETEVVAVDSEAPEFRNISDLTVYCGDESMNDKISAWLTAAKDSVSDNCAISTVSNNYNQEMLPADGCGSVLVTFYATDNCNNIDSSDAYIRVYDTLKPVLTIEDVTISCTNDTAFAAAVNGWINTLDVQTCGDTSYTYNDASTVVENNCGTYRVTFSATNTCSVSNLIVATVTVVDNELPVLVGEIADRTIYVDGECNYDASSIEKIIVTDNCAPKLAPKFSDDTLTNVYGADSLIIRTWTSEADCGRNTAQSVEQRISIVDTIKPEFIANNSNPEFIANNSNLEILCDDTNRVAAVANWLESISATDNCNIHSITNNYNADNLPTGCDTLDVTFTATDNYGNSTIAVYTIKSIDNRAPEFAEIDTLDVDYCATDRDAQIAEWLQAVNATDNCSGVAAIVNNYDSLPTIGCGEVEVTFTATDACGNSSTTTGIINVTHTATPVVSAQDTTIECGSGLEAALNTWIAGFSATADCGYSNVTLSVNTDQVKDSCGTYTAIITATDGCGVSGTTNVSVTISDTTKPVFVPDYHRNREITLNNDCEYDTIPFDSEIYGVKDNCTDELQALYSDTVLTNIYGADSVIIRTWTSEEDCGGNSADPITQEITIVDQFVPVFAQLKVDSICKGPEYTPNADYVAGEISDNCADEDFLRSHLTYTPTTTNNPVAVNDTTIITWTVIDNYGNSVQATQMVIHFAAPIVEISGETEICEGATAELIPSVSNYSDVTYAWSDNVEVENNSVATVPAGTYTVTATTTLGCVGTASFTVANYEIPEASIELPQSICDGATLPISYNANMNGTWNFVVTGAIVDTLSAISDTGIVTTTTVAAGPVVNVAATFTYADNCELVVEEGTAVKVGSYPKLLIEQGETFATAVEDNDVETSLDAPIKFYLHVVPSDPNCPPSDDLRVSIDYQFSKDGVVLDNTNPLTNYLDDPNIPDPFYVTFKTKRFGLDYFTYTHNEGVFHYPYIAASYAGATHNFDYFRYEYIENREISVDISGFITSGEYDIDFQLVTHYHPGTTTPYGDAVPGYQDGVEVGGHQFYINPFDIDTLAVNTMSIVVNSTPSDPVAPNTFGESFNHSAEELTVAEREMTIYPNPTTSDYVNVAFKNVTGKTIVRVLNMNGKLVDQFEVNILDDEFIYRYALDRVAPGVYFINAVSNDATFTKKVIIQNK